MPDIKRTTAELRKIQSGCYEHVPTGRLVVRTDDWEGTAGGKLSWWEHARLGSDGEIEIDGIELFRTRRDAVAALCPVDTEAVESRLDELLALERVA